MHRPDPWIRLERVLLDLTGRFAHASAGQVSAEIERGLKTVSGCLRARACALVEPPEQPGPEWLTCFQAATCAPGRGAAAFPWNSQALQRGSLIVRERAPDALLPWLGTEPTSAPAAGRRLSVVVPIRMGSPLLGALLFELDVRQISWSAERAAQLQDVAAVFAHALQRQRAEAQLEVALSFEQLLLELASLVARGPPAALELAIAEGLRRLAKTLSLEPLTLFEFAGSGGAPRPIGCTSTAAAASALSPLRAKLPELWDRLVGGEVISLAPDAHVWDLPDPDRVTAPGQAPALLVLPLPVRGAPLFALCAASTQTQPWPAEQLIPRLGLAGSIFASAWANAQNSVAPLPTAGLDGLHALSVRAASIHAPQRPAPGRPFEAVIGQSDLLRYVLFKVDQVAPTNATTLLLGETGTGKGLLARTIHERGSRRAHPLITVNCAALPAGLIETELFGCEKGAFTGAYRSHPGRFELAHRGTILLDEVGDLPLELQPKLLRVLQDGAFERVGSTHTLNVDVRVIAATNRNLQDDVRQGLFREDLYYRLSVFPITLPALRERRDDIPALVHHLVARLSLQFGKPIEWIPPAVMELLQLHAWPGNIRELENVLTRALIVATDTTLRLADPLVSPSLATEAPSARLAQVERLHIHHILSRHRWLIEGPGGAASALGMHPSTLRGRMRKLRIQRPE